VSDSYETLEYIFFAVEDGAKRLLWHMTLLDIQTLPELTGPRTAC
jgi:hypothetical protein